MVTRTPAPTPIALNVTTEGERMPWLAQHEGGHPHYADGELAKVYRHLGYVEVPAPGTDGQAVEAEPDRDDFGEALPHFDPVNGVEDDTLELDG